MKVIILAGGRATRMGGKEKAMIELGAEKEVRMIDMVIDAVKGASEVSAFIIAVTKYTPRTGLYCRSMNYRTIETPGYGYHADLRYLLRHHREFISVACDIPFLQSGHIDALIDFYSECHTCITGAVPSSIVPEGISPGFSFSYRGYKLVACGINAVTNPRQTSTYDSIPFIFHDPMLAINVNTPSDLEIAMRYLREGGGKLFIRGIKSR